VRSTVPVGGGRSPLALALIARMNSEYETSLRQSTVPELLIARMTLQGRRNLALFVGLVAVVVIAWARWSFWAFIVPSLIWFAVRESRALSRRGGCRSVLSLGVARVSPNDGNQVPT